MSELPHSLTVLLLLLLLPRSPTIALHWDWRLAPHWTAVQWAVAHSQVAVRAQGAPRLLTVPCTFRTITQAKATSPWAVGCAQSRRTGEKAGNASAMV